jgi:hypothetical protein
VLLGWSDIRGIEPDLSTLPQTETQMKSFRNQMVLSGSECPMWSVVRNAVYAASIHVFGGVGNQRADIVLKAISSQNVPPQGVLSLVD